jgi:2',3'-cyclic-nucleotide 2'-phosphodiesterase (5'-nucleotidase family)
MLRTLLSVAVMLGLAGCPGTPAKGPGGGGGGGDGSNAGSVGPGKGKLARGSVTISIVGTNDLHGAVGQLPILAGYVANLRAARAQDGGAVLLLDGGDMFQGTLESNLNEGEAVIAAYNLIGYDAVTVGNHEFDFGPEGPAATVEAEGDDPRGALKARATEAKFPVLMANVNEAGAGQRPAWPNMPASVLLEKAGVSIGVIGVTTEATPFTTMPANFLGLEMAPVAATILAEATALRARGAEVIVVAAHAGSKCEELTDPSDTSSCDTEEEIFQVAEALPAGTVDVIVAGHTHAAMAHRVNDIAIIESYASGRAFGRVDLRINKNGVVTGASIHTPQDLCAAAPSAGEGGDGASSDEADKPACAPGDYEGAPVVPDARVAAAIAGAIDQAREIREEPLGVTLASEIWKSYDAESPQGNLFVDLMLDVVADADVALTNGGGLRAHLPAGPLTYGELYEAMPFDNRFAVVAVTGANVRRMVTNNLHGASGIFSWGGIRVKATCTKKGDLDVALTDRKGKAIKDDRKLLLVTSDFLASGGDGVIGRLKLADGAVDLSDGRIIREAIAGALKKRGGTITASSLYDPKKPRLAYPGKRPVKCGQPASAPDEPD